MLCIHDEAMGTAMNRYGIKLRETDDSDPILRQAGLQRMLLLLLIVALLRRHRRMEYIFGLRGGPMSDYMQETSTMEREHMAELVSMIHNMI